MYPLVKATLFYEVYPLAPPGTGLHSTEEERPLLEYSHIWGTLQYVRPPLNPRRVGVCILKNGKSFALQIERTTKNA